MITVPNGATEFPADYMDFLRGLTTDRIFSIGRLFAVPRDPGEALGKQGSENYVYSVLIGSRTDGLHIVLTYASLKAYAPPEWRYNITSGAEWNVVAEFKVIGELVSFLESERPARA